MAKKKVARRPPKRRKRSKPIPRLAAREQPASVDAPFPIVGIGASAGGLEAFSQLLNALPENPGIAIVLIPHLAPHHESAIAAILSSRTKLPVVQALEGMRIERDRVYVIPPNVQMEMIDETLHLNPRPTDRSQYTPIDFFLRSLAESAQERAIAVILSGTASDGTGGVREVKGVGGIAFAQTPDSARYDGMPRAAIATGVVDMVLSPEAIAAELVRIAQHPFARPVSPGADEPSDVGEGPLRRILAVLRRATGVDFTRYKRPTIERRLHRRMVLHKISRREQYLEYLQTNPAEVQALYRDILIHVTRFFREPESFTVLQEVVFPHILASRHDEQPVRIWVPGCSTGEEAYSAAIALLEYLGEHDGVPIQVFATDVSEPAIEHARAGFYPDGIAADVSPERLRRFFTKMESGYRIGKIVRDVCVFARQDLTRDPPFSKLDLIICRNVLIYMGSELQKKLMTVFHYALKSTGFLMLGSAETIGLHSDLFGATSDKKHRLYQKKLGPSPVLSFPVEHAAPVHPSLDRPAAPMSDRNRMVVNEANRIVQERFAPPGVIVDADLQVLQFRGQTGRFLEPAPGDPSLSLLKMAREGLLHGLRAAIQESRRTGMSVRRERVRVRGNGDWREINLQVVPLGRGDRPHRLVLFEDAPPRARGGGGKPAPRTRAAAPARSVRDERARRLEQELASSREYLQSIIQELEAANEELQSANEEILSSNEELQSTNEELDTAKEELQSTNEELNTVNEELHARNDELTRVNSDLVNLLGSVQIAIVIVTTDLRIRRFTPMAEKLLNLMPGDLGRSIAHINPNIDCPDLEGSIARVIETVTPLEREVRDRQGNWLSLRIRPYKSIDNRIDGAVIALFDIQSKKSSQELVRQARAWADAVLELVHEPLVVVDAGLRVQAANAAFGETLGIPVHEAENRPFLELGRGEWNAPALRALLEQLLADHGDGKVMRLEHELGAGRKKLVVNARRIGADGGPFILLTLEESRPRGGGAGRAQ